MIYFIRYTPEAIRDMDSVWDSVFEASKSFDIANNYVNEFSKRISNKKQFPLTGSPLIYRGLFTGFYSVNFKKYKAFYRVNDKYIEVIRIIMSKKDYMTILFGETNE